MAGWLETSFFRQSRFSKWHCAFHVARGHPCNVSWEHATVWRLDVLSPWFSHRSRWCFRNLADIVGWRTLPFVLWSSKHIYILKTDKNNHQHKHTHRNVNHLNFPTPFFTLFLFLKEIFAKGSLVINVTRTPGMGSIPNIRRTWTCECPPPTKTKSLMMGVLAKCVAKTPGHKNATKKAMLCTIWRDKHDWNW